MRHAALTVRALAALALVLPASGCYLFSTGGDGGPDAAAGRDAECLSFGATRLCGEACPLPCPEGFSCWEPEVVQFCLEDFPDDPRGEEWCVVDVSLGGGFCYSGRYCAVPEAGFDPRGSDGPCVDEGYCAWARERGLGVQCRYSEGQPYVDGPPDVPCGTGAMAGAGFCGGACGDTCGLDPLWPRFRPAACVGLSEERGFGVCAPSSLRCAPPSPETSFLECGRRVAPTSPFPFDICACMLLPGPLPEYADHGWAVARQTCLAYQRYFPGQVRCVDETWTDL